MDLTDPQQWNAYGYANGNPVTFSDPSGLMTKVDGGGGGLGPVSKVAPPVCNGGNTSPNCGGVANKSPGGYSSKTVTLPNGTVLTTSATGASINGYHLQPNSPNAESLAADVDHILSGRSYGNDLDLSIDTVWALRAACNAHGSYNCMDDGLVGLPGPSFYTTVSNDLTSLMAAKGSLDGGMSVEEAILMTAGAAGSAIFGASNARSGGFTNGGLYEATYTTPNGVTIGVEAEIRVKGKLVYFDNVLVFASKNGVSLRPNELGTGPMLAVRNAMLADAWQAGFRHYGMSYHRTTKSSAEGLSVSYVRPIPPPMAPGGDRK